MSAGENNVTTQSRLDPPATAKGEAGPGGESRAKKSVEDNADGIIACSGTYIWQGLKPCFKMLFTIGCGFLLARKGLFPPAASKGLAQVTMNIGLPCLLFSSMVPSFNSENISNFGPLCLVAIIIMAIGLTLSLIIREVFYVPANFQWGILVIGMISNWGNLPTAVVQSVAGEAPFNPAVDPTLGIAYIAVFILILNITFYGSGLYRICGWDYSENLEPTPPTFAGRVARRKRQFRRLMEWISHKRHTGSKVAKEKEDDSHTESISETAATRLQNITHPTSPAPKPAFSALQRHLSSSSARSGRASAAEIEAITFETSDTGATAMRPASTSSSAQQAQKRPSRGPVTIDKIEEEEDKIGLAEDEEANKTNLIASRPQDRAPPSREPSIHNESPHVTVFKAIFNSLLGLLTPATMGVIVSLPFALVDPLKALMVHVDGWSGTKINNAPDGQPPLSFFYDFTEFVGAMTIPGGLILLGSSFARLKFNRSKLRELPLKAIFASAIAKLLITPIIGIFMIIGFRENTTLFPRDQKMLSFAAFMVSGTPSAVNQLTVTQIFLKDGQSLDILAAFLLVQYLALLVQSAALTAISIWLVQR